jgi:hypothetical protein
MQTGGIMTGENPIEKTVRKSNEKKLCAWVIRSLGGILLFFCSV